MKSAAASVLPEPATFPWSIPGCIADWETPPFGNWTLDGSVVASMADVQPASTWPAGKTGTFDIATAAGQRPEWRFEDGRFELFNLGGVAKDLHSSDAELDAFLSSKNPFSALTIWRLDAGAPADMMQTLRINPAGPYYVLGSDGSQNLRFAWYDGVHPVHYVTAAGTATANMVADATTFDGTYLRLYRNGLLVAGPEEITEDAITSASLYIYVRNGSFCGRSLWNRAISVDEVKSQTVAACKRRIIPL